MAVPLLSPLSQIRPARVIETPVEKQEVSEREKLINSLRNQTLRLPNLRPYFQDWPIKINPHVDELRRDINEWLGRILSPGKALDALINSDFGYFGAAWWPHASLDRLKVLTYFSVWLFLWDDEIDSREGSLGSAFASAQSYRSQTLAFIRYSLGLQDENPKVNNRIILGFAPIGEGLRKVYTAAQRQRVYDEVVYYIQMCEKEQLLRLSGAIPSVSEYWAIRLGSSAVGVSLSTNEYSYEDMNLSSVILNDPDMALLWKCTNTAISATNDLYSVKKEIANFAIESLIPILYQQIGDIQEAVNETVSFIHSELISFEGAAKRLVARHGIDEQIKSDIEDYIDGCRYAFIGNWIWSLKTDRYKIGKQDSRGDVFLTI